MNLHDELSSLMLHQNTSHKGVRSMTTLTRRELASAAATLAGLSLLRPAAVLAAANSAPSLAPIDPMNLVDPELKPILQASLKQAPHMEWSERTLHEVRKQSGFWTRPALAQPNFFERMIPPFS